MVMAHKGVVLSDVHCVGAVGSPAEAGCGSDDHDAYVYRCSEFTFSCGIGNGGWVVEAGWCHVDSQERATEQCASEAESGNTDVVVFDDDGDAVVERRTPSAAVCIPTTTDIAICHSMGTTLKDVGYQVWSSAFLLCDYIISSQALLRDKVLLELGCGPGLSAIVAAVARPKAVLCTDIASVLPLCLKNMERSRHLIPDGVACHVKTLDWRSKCGLFPAEDCAFGWSCEQASLAQDADYLLASDVVYDQDLTEAFFTWLHYLMSHHPPMTALIATEERLNFSTDLQAIASPAHEHFRDCLEQLSNCNCDMHPGLEFQVARLPLEFPCYSRMSRSAFMSLVQITVRPDPEDSSR